jgi:hypothetical protein
MDANPYAAPQTAYSRLPSGATATQVTIDLGFVVEAEKTFQLKVTQDDILAWTTVDDLYQWFVRHCDEFTIRCKVNDSPRSLSDETLSRIRTALADVLRIPPDRAQSVTPLDELLPPQGRRKAWSDLQSAMKLRLPPLHRPRWLVAILTALAPAGIAASIWAYVLVPRFNAGELWTAILASILVVVVAVRLTRRCAVYPGREFETVDSLTRVVLTDNFSQLRYECGGAQPEDIWAALCVLLARYDVEKPDGIRRDATLRFI